MPSIHNTIPSSSSTVSVRCINVTTDDSDVPAALFLEPVLSGREALPAPAYAFLIEHPEKKKRIMFDLGPRKDTDKLSPTLLAQFGSIPGFNMKVEKDVVEQLNAEGIGPDDIDIVIW
ncbi:hypothetical protein MPER_07448, partial [Moniliophthora perniciosa FA553]